jgi:hypothetical protein
MAVSLGLRRRNGPSWPGRGVIATVIAATAAGTAPIARDETSRLFAAERRYWVATTSDQTRPRLQPVLVI